MDTQPSARTGKSSASKSLVTLLLVLLVGVVGYIIWHNQTTADDRENEQLTRELQRKQMLAVGPSDHVYGPRDAQVKMIVYSDTRCQYCRLAVPILMDIVDSYDDGSVAMVYRHIPIYYYRGTVTDAEIAGMCVAQERGDEGFFTFIRTLFPQLPPFNELAEMPKAALELSVEAAGVSYETLQQCFLDETGKEVIQAHHNTGGILGVISVPHIFFTNGEVVHEINSSLYESTFTPIVESLLE